jgi:hypothetical protein
MQKKWMVMSALLLSLGFFGCPPKNEGGGAAGGGATGSGDILVGEYGSLTGPQATFGQSTHNGIMMAADEINAAGGINGRKIKVLTEDDQSKQEEAANAVTKLISQNNVLAVLGEVASSSSIAAAPICQSNKVPMITPSSTNDTVTQKGDYIFRVCFTDSYQGSALGNYAAKGGGFKRAALLTDVKSDYSARSSRRPSPRTADRSSPSRATPTATATSARSSRRSKRRTPTSSSSPATTPTSARSPSSARTSAWAFRCSAATAGNRRS